MEKHLSVQKRIKQIASHFTGCNYFFANWQQLNEALEEVKKGKPVICYILPPSGRLSIKHSATYFVDKPSTLIAFLVHTEVDFDGEENDELIEQMKSLFRSFLKVLNASGLFEPIDDEEISYDVAYDDTDDCVTGILVNLPLVETTYAECALSDEFGYVEDI